MTSKGKPSMRSRSATKRVGLLRTEEGAGPKRLLYSLLSLF